MENSESFKRLLVRALDIPVIAAGGITNGAGMGWLAAIAKERLARRQVAAIFSGG